MDSSSSFPFSLVAGLRCNVGLPGKTEGVIFTPVPCEVVYSDPERVAVSALREAGASSTGMTDIVPDILQINRCASTWAVNAITPDECAQSSSGSGRGTRTGPAAGPMFLPKIYIFINKRHVSPRSFAKVTRIIIIMSDTAI